MKEAGIRRQMDPPGPWYDYFCRNGADPSGTFVSRIPVGMEANSIINLKAEAGWLSQGEPYFKVYPQMAAMMSEVSIDIPVDSFLMPYQTFAVLLADSPDNDLWEYWTDRFTGEVIKGPRLRWILVHELRVASINEAEFKYLTVDSTGGSRALYLNYDFEGEYRGEPQQYNYTMSLDTRVGTLQQFFDQSYAATDEKVAKQFRPNEYRPSREMVQKVMSIAVATAFFGTDRHEVVLPDLPRKKLEAKMRRAKGDPTEAKKIIRDERVGTKAWTIGREINLPRPIAQRATPEGNGHGISHAYLRRGHMRYQACGEGRQYRKLIFIHPHMVRDDLPLAPTHGFRISDSNLKGV